MTLPSVHYRPGSVRSGAAMHKTKRVKLSTSRSEEPVLRWAFSALHDANMISSVHAEVGRLMHAFRLWKRNCSCIVRSSIVAVCGNFKSMARALRLWFANVARYAEAGPLSLHIHCASHAAALESALHLWLQYIRNDLTILAAYHSFLCAGRAAIAIWFASTYLSKDGERAATSSRRQHFTPFFQTLVQLPTALLCSSTRVRADRVRNAFRGWRLMRGWALIDYERDRVRLSASEYHRNASFPLWT